MRIYVLDASAWLRLFLGDGPVSSALGQAASEVERGLAVFAAPDLILVEASHVLRRKFREKRLEAGEADELWRDMNRVPLRLVGIPEVIGAAFQLSESVPLSLYDTLYLATARQIGATLLTADMALDREASRLGLSP